MAGPTLAPTHLTILRDRKDGSLTICEAQSGASFKRVCDDLSAGHVQAWADLASVQLADPAAGRLVDVTKRVLHEVAAICEALGWEHSPRLDAAFAAYDVAPPVYVEPDIRDPNDEHRLGVHDVIGRAA